MKTTDQNKNFNINFSEVYKKVGILIIFILAVIISACINPIFPTANNMLNILRQAVITLILACGMQTILLCGMIDLSCGSILAFSGAITASMIVNGWNLVAALVVGLLAGAVCGFANGIIVVTFRIPTFIMTLATQSIIRGVVLLYMHNIPISNLGNEFAFIGQGNIGGVFPFSVVILAVVVGITAVLVNKKRFGRNLYAIGGNEQAARAAGVNVKKVKVLVFTYAGLLAGLAGIVLAARSNSAQPTAGEGYEFDAITAAVVGGTSLSGGVGKVSGMIFGGLLVVVLKNIMTLTAIDSNVQKIVQGAIILIAVIADIALQKGDKNASVK